MDLAPRAGRARLGRAISTIALAFLGIACAPLSALAQSWPERAITLIVPFAAGGASDVSSRIMAEAMGKQLGQNVIIENVAGAGGATGSLRGKNASPTATRSGSATWARMRRPWRRTPSCRTTPGPTSTTWASTS